MRTTTRMLGRLLLSVALTGCARFVWHEDSFTPDQAPVSEVVVSGGDTMFVARGASYYLLARDRSALWNRQVLEDAAWRYRRLFGDAPPLIAVRVEGPDSQPTGDARARADSGATWRGVPLVTVTPRRGTPAVPGRRDRLHDPEPELDSLAQGRLTASALAAKAAGAWLRARARDVVRSADAQPGGPAATPAAPTSYPAWFEMGVVATLASDGMVLRSLAAVRADQKNVVPIATLFAVKRAGRASEGPLFLAQSVSVLSYLRERDASFVARLADALAHGRTISDALATSPTLPRDIAALDADWRDWLRRAGRRR